MDADNKTPARRLVGKVLTNDWTVIKRLKRPPGATGGTFSASYVIKSKDGKMAFLKAMDYTEALESTDPARALQKLTKVYNFERDILEKCKSRRLSRIVQVLDVGTIPRATPNDASSVVQYLIFELADGDIRSYTPTSGKRLQLAWTLRRLHQTTAALQQLHYCGIAHQDVKPSNVLVFNGDILKLADLGRASDKQNTSPFDAHKIAGDRTYAPPELLYGELHKDWDVRRLAYDMYLLGSMVSYFLTGTSMTHLLLSRLDNRFHPNRWGGVYRDVVPYIEHEFYRIIGEIKRHIPDRYSEEICRTIEQLCNPDPEQRGHPKGFESKHVATRYSVERYISIFDRLAKRAEYDTKLSNQKRIWLV